MTGCAMLRGPSVAETDEIDNTGPGGNTGRRSRGSGHRRCFRCCLQEKYSGGWFRRLGVAEPLTIGDISAPMRYCQQTVFNPGLGPRQILLVSRLVGKGTVQAGAELTHLLIRKHR